jgi:Leucine-rich repeat (LRR) protein
VNLNINPKVSDAGLAHFQDCKNLTVLGLSGTRVGDAGLAHFKDCQNLTVLDLDATQVSDAGLAHFKDCENLTELRLNHTQVSDVGLAHFKGCENLQRLQLHQTKVNDAGLAHLKDCENLAALRLSDTQVSDAGLADLERLPSLRDLNLDNTRISLRGRERLKSVLPKCQVTGSETNRAVAESVLALGGTVEIGARDGLESRPVKVAADLPRDNFQVRRVSLAGVAKPLDNLPALLSCLRFPEFDRLESLDLSGIVGLKYDFLVPIHGLRELSLANAGLNDATLLKLPKLPALKRLVLDGNEDVRGAGWTSLAGYLAGYPELIDLSLGCPTFTNLFAKNLAELKQLKRLSLASSGLSDAGIKHLAALTNLEALDLRRTRVRAAGIAELQKALPKCQIEWDGMKNP